MAQTLYWVGDTDTLWNKVNNWATTSGGVGGANGATVPTIADIARLDGGSAVNCTCDVGIAVNYLVLQSTYSGDLDLASYSHNAASQVSLSGVGTVDPGTCTLNTNSFGNSGQTSWISGTAWTLNLMGGGGLQPRTTGAIGYLNIYGYLVCSTTWTGPDLGFYQAPGVLIDAENNWTIPASCSTATISGNLAIDGSLESQNDDFRVTATGEISHYGTSRWTVREGAITEAAGIINPYDLVIYGNGAAAPGTYSCPVTFTHGGSTETLTFAAGDYYFLDPVNFSGFFAGTYEVDLTSNPNLTFTSNFSISDGSGVITWNKGTGTLTFNSSTDQDVDFSNKSVENIVIEPGGGADIYFTNNFTATSFTLASGLWFPNPKTYVTTGDFTILEGGNPMSLSPWSELWGGVDLTVGGTFTAWGSPADKCNLQGDSGWTLNVATAGTANNVIVSGSDASAGVPIYAKDSIDG